MNRQNTAVLLLTALFFVGGATALVQSHPISEIVVDTTNLVDNLNADLLDGHQGSYYQDTNAQTICPDGKILDGSGNCVSSSSGGSFVGSGNTLNHYTDSARCSGRDCSSATAVSCPINEAAIGLKTTGDAVDATCGSLGTGIRQKLKVGGWKSVVGKAIGYTSDGGCYEARISCKPIPNWKNRNLILGDYIVSPWEGGDNCEERTEEVEEEIIKADTSEKAGTYKVSFDWKLDTAWHGGESYIKWEKTGDGQSGFDWERSISGADKSKSGSFSDNIQLQKGEGLKIHVYAHDCYSKTSFKNGRAEWVG